MIDNLTEVNNIYCTYFDKGFLLKGLALHASLIRYNPNAKLWILAFDGSTENVLKKMSLRGVTVISLTDFEDKDPLSIKATRHPVEYYWTCTPSWVLYVLKNSGAKYATYLDADLYFYSDADRGLSEIGSKSLLAVEHRFPVGHKDLAKKSGRFNVAFNVFKNDIIGKKCLQRWRRQCLDWCYWQHTNGKIGDQGYLDEWPKLYGDNLVISKNIGVDVAPWNVSQYKISNKESRNYINNKLLVCYHFHQFQILGPNRYSRVLAYTLSSDVLKYIYHPYEHELYDQYEIVRKYDKSFKIEKNIKDDKESPKEKLVRYFGPVYRRIKAILVAN